MNDRYYNIMPHHHPPTWKAIVMYAVAVCNILFNIPVLLITPRRVPNLMRSMRYTMITLAIADLLLGVQSFIRLIHFEMQDDYYLEEDTFMCKWDGFLNNYLASVSIMIMSTLSLDKLLTIRYPLRYTVFMTKRRIIMSLAGVSVLVFALFLPCLVGEPPGYDPDAYICIAVSQHIIQSICILLFIQVLPAVTIITSFIMIWCSVKKARVFRRQSVTATFGTQTNNGPQKTTTDQKSAMKTVKTLVIMSAGYYIMWVPFFVLVAYWQVVNDSSFSRLSDFITPWLGAANSLVNPLIYIPTLKSYRQALCQLLRLRRPSTVTSGGLSASGSTAETMSGSYQLQHSTAINMHNLRRPSPANM